MGDSICPIGISQFAEPKTVIHERLIGMRANVAMDGSSTSFAVQFADQHAFRVMIPLEQIPAIFAEVSYATKAMLARSSFSLDRGASKLKDFIQAAIRPRDADVLIDPATNDRLFVFQFLEHAPFSLRMTPVQVEYLLGRLSRSRAASYH